ncbi:hypothetical protein ACS0PU_002029, partial [Formica fusca]
RRRSHRLNPII